MNKLKNFFKSAKAKVGAVLTAGVVGVSSSNAADGITFAKDTGFAGSFDLTYYYSAIAIVAAIGLGIRQFKKI